MEEKRKLIAELRWFKAQGVPVSKDFNVTSDIEEMRSEAFTCRELRKRQHAMKQLRRMHVGFVGLLEFANSKWDPLGLMLDGTSDDIDADFQSIYQPTWEQIYEQYKEHWGAINPFIMLGILTLMAFGHRHNLNSEAAEERKKSSQQAQTFAAQDAARAAPPPPPPPSNVQIARIAERMPPAPPRFPAPPPPPAPKGAAGLRNAMGLLSGMTGSSAEVPADAQANMSSAVNAVMGQMIDPRTGQPRLPEVEAMAPSDDEGPGPQPGVPAPLNPQGGGGGDRDSLSPSEGSDKEDGSGSTSSSSGGAESDAGEPVVTLPPPARGRGRGRGRARGRAAKR